MDSNLQKKPFVKIAKKLTNYISNSSIGKKITKTLTKGANDLADEAVELLSDNVGKNGNKIRNKLKELFSKPKKKAKAVGNKKPSEIAKSWQGHGNYPGVDDYDDIIVNKGTTLYRGEPNGSDYFTTLDAIDSSNRNAKNLFEGLQVRKDPVYGYRNEMQGYFFNNDILGAHGITKANPQYGKGGLPQYFIPNSQKLINNGTLKPTNIIRLTK